MKKLSKLQIKHFDRMSRSELQEALRDSIKQQGVIVFSTTKAGAERYQELQARIDYIEKRLQTK